MKKMWTLLSLVMVVSCQESTGKNAVAVISKKNQQSEVKYVDGVVLSSHMGHLIGNISEKVTETLELNDPSERIPWELSRVTVGLGVEAEFEVLDEALELETEGDIELRFQKI